MKRFTIVLPLALLGAACQSKAPAAAANPHATQTPTAVPANISHGEAPVGTGTSPAPIDAAAPPRGMSHLQRIRFEISDATVQIATSVNYSAWTFDKRVPGPFLRATVGDTIDFTLVNTAMMPHSMDFHAAELAPSKHYVNVMPHDSLHYRFVPHVPGVPANRFLLTAMGAQPIKPTPNATTTETYPSFMMFPLVLRPDQMKMPAAVAAILQAAKPAPQHRRFRATRHRQ